MIIINAIAFLNLLFSVLKFGRLIIFSTSLNNVTQNKLTHKLSRKGCYTEYNMTIHLLKTTDTVCMLLKI